MLKNKKIALLVGSLSGAGAEKSVLVLAESLAALGVEVHLIVLKNIFDYTASDKIHIWCAEVLHHNKRKAMQIIAGQLHDLDLFVTSRAEFYHCQIRCLKRYCWVHITPTAWIKPYKMRFRVWLKKLQLYIKFRTKKLLVVSHGVKTDLVHNLGIKATDVQVLHDAYDFAGIRADAEANINLPQQIKNNYIICVGAFIARKRHADLFDAFARLEDKSVHLVLIGKGPLEAALKQQAQALNIAAKVHFIGWQANPYAYIKNAKISVLTAQAEGMPRSLIESIIIGTAVVATDCPSGPNEILSDQYVSQLVPVGDVQAISRAIDSTLRHPIVIPEAKISGFDSRLIAARYVQL